MHLRVKHCPYVNMYVNSFNIYCVYLKIPCTRVGRGPAPQPTLNCGYGVKSGMHVSGMNVVTGSFASALSRRRGLCFRVAFAVTQAPES